MVELDLLLGNARVRTMDRSRPTARSVGIWNGMIVGLDEEVESLPARRRVDLAGATLLPGFHDAHCHATSFGVALALLDLSPVASREGLLASVAERARSLPAGEWLIGMGYGDLDGLQRHPTREELDRVGGDRPVWLTHVSGHACMLNTAALAAVGLTDSSTAPPGGVIGRDERGRLTGYLEDMAMDRVKEHVGPASSSDLVDAIESATAVFASEGITSFVEAGVGCPGIDHSPVEIHSYQVARETNRLRARAQLMVYSEILHALPSHPADGVDLGLDLGMRTGLGDPMLSVGAMKIWVDGSGLLVPEGGGDPVVGFQDAPERLRETISAAHRAGWQVGAHAIAPEALDLVLETLESLDDASGCRQRRHRIEHGGVASAEQLRRMADLGVVSVIQPMFIDAFGDRMIEVLGADRAGRAVRAASSAQAGVILAGSSDRPVADGAPLKGIQAMAQRLTASGRVMGDRERTPVQDALLAYTRDGAFAAHREADFGVIAPRRRGDLVVLAEDPLAVAVERISAIEVLATLVDGETTHDPGLLFPSASEAS